MAPFVRKGFVHAGTSQSVIFGLSRFPEGSYYISSRLLRSINCASSSLSAWDWFLPFSCNWHCFDVSLLAHNWSNLELILVCLLRIFDVCHASCLQIRGNCPSSLVVSLPYCTNLICYKMSAFSVAVITVVASVCVAFEFVCVVLIIANAVSGFATPRFVHIFSSDFCRNFSRFYGVRVCLALFGSVAGAQLSDRSVLVSELLFVFYLIQRGSRWADTGVRGDNNINSIATL